MPPRKKPKSTTEGGTNEDTTTTALPRPKRSRKEKRQDKEADASRQAQQLLDVLQQTEADENNMDRKCITAYGSRRKAVCMALKTEENHMGQTLSDVFCQRRTQYEIRRDLAMPPILVWSFRIFLFCFGGTPECPDIRTLSQKWQQFMQDTFHQKRDPEQRRVMLLQILRRHSIAADQRTSSVSQLHTQAVAAYAALQEAKARGDAEEGQEEGETERNAIDELIDLNEDQSPTTTTTAHENKKKRPSKKTEELIQQKEAEYTHLHNMMVVIRYQTEATRMRRARPLAYTPDQEPDIWWPLKQYVFSYYWLHRAPDTALVHDQRAIVDGTIQFGGTAGANKRVVPSSTTTSEVDDDDDGEDESREPCPGSNNFSLAYCLHTGGTGEKRCAMPSADDIYDMYRWSVQQIQDIRVEYTLPTFEEWLLSYDHDHGGDGGGASAPPLPPSAVVSQEEWLFERRLRKLTSVMNRQKKMPPGTAGLSQQEQHLWRGMGRNAEDPTRRRYFPDMNTAQFKKMQEDRDRVDFQWNWLQKYRRDEQPWNALDSDAHHVHPYEQFLFESVHPTGSALDMYRWIARKRVELYGFANDHERDEWNAHRARETTTTTTTTAAPPQASATTPTASERRRWEERMQHPQAPQPMGFEMWKRTAEALASISTLEAENWNAHLQGASSSSNSDASLEQYIARVRYRDYVERWKAESLRAFVEAERALWADRTRKIDVRQQYAQEIAAGYGHTTKETALRHLQGAHARTVAEATKQDRDRFQKWRRSMLQRMRPAQPQVPLTRQEFAALTEEELCTVVRELGLHLHPDHPERVQKERDYAVYGRNPNAGPTTARPPATTATAKKTRTQVHHEIEHATFSTPLINGLKAAEKVHTNTWAALEQEAMRFFATSQRLTQYTTEDFLSLIRLVSKHFFASMPLNGTKNVPIERFVVTVVRDDDDVSPLAGVPPTAGVLGKHFAIRAWMLDDVTAQVEVNAPLMDWVMDCVEDKVSRPDKKRKTPLFPPGSLSLQWGSLPETLRRRFAWICRELVLALCYVQTGEDDTRASFLMQMLLGNHPDRPQSGGPCWSIQRDEGDSTTVPVSPLDLGNEYTARQS